MPEGVANRFQAVAPGISQLLYGFSTEWRPDLPGSAVTPLDSDFGLDWPLPFDRDDRTHISAKAAAAPNFQPLRAPDSRLTG